MNIFSPLEQFTIVPLIPIRLGNIDISFTNSSLMMALLIGLFLFAVNASLSKSTLVPQRWQSMMEMLYEFVIDLVYSNIGPKGLRYFPFLFVLFTFILLSNLLGMIPYSFTVTSHIAVTLGLSLSIWIGVTLLGLYHHKLHFFSFFFPEGTPLAIAPLVIGIEIVSYLSRAVSLAIRLFANMMSGHTLFKILAGFSWTMLGMGGAIFFAGFLPLIVITVLTGLELFIAALQAYIFTILTAIYLNDGINLH